MSLSHKLIIADSFNPDISEQVVLIQGTDHGLPCTKPASLNDRWRLLKRKSPFTSGSVAQSLDAFFRMSLFIFFLFVEAGSHRAVWIVWAGFEVWILLLQPSE